jgi:hypothetical protein
MGEHVLSLAESKAIDTPTSGLPAGSEGDAVLLAGLGMPVGKLFELLGRLQHYLATSLPPDAEDVPDGRSGEGQDTKSRSKGDEGEQVKPNGTSGVASEREGDAPPRSRTRMTVLGSYDACFSGVELREWLLRNVSPPSRNSLQSLALNDRSSRSKGSGMILRGARKPGRRSSSGAW